MPRTLASIRFFVTVSFAAFATIGLAQPVINAVENNYSYVPPGLPNYGIAQGSIFVIFGSNLAPTSSGLQGLPLHMTLSGVSVQFDVHGSSTQALLYYVMPNQIAGVLPSATATGTGTVVVTSNGQRSAPAPLTVVQSAVGILTGLGLFEAIAFDTNWRSLSPANAANAGDVVVLYGSGVGPVAGDESVEQTPQNLSNIPLEVDIGGIPATIAYRGRSVYPGLDQINVVIPVGTEGCNVSVVARSGSIVSNTGFLPIAAASRGCTDQIKGVSVGPSQVLTGKSAFNTAYLSLRTHLNSLPPMSAGGTSVPARILASTTMGGQFLQETLSEPGTLTLGSTGVFPSLGNCSTTPYSFPMLNQNRTPAEATQPNLLNAGPEIHFTGPNGEASALYQAFQPGTYAGTLGGTDSNAVPFIPVGGGPFTIDNGSGGPEVGPFVAHINVPPPLVWSNMNSISSIDRSQGLTITWTGGDPSGFVTIIGNSHASTATEMIGAQVSCTVAVSAHQFTIPASALLALPPQSISTGTNAVPSVQVGSDSGFLFSAPELDGGLILAGATDNLAVAYQ